MWLDWPVFCDYGLSALWCLSQHLLSYLGFSYLERKVSTFSYRKWYLFLLLQLCPLKDYVMRLPPHLFLNSDLPLHFFSELLLSVDSSWSAIGTSPFRKQQLELDMEQQTGSKKKRRMSRLYIVTLIIQLICRVHHEKRWAGRNTNWNQDCREK